MVKLRYGKRVQNRQKLHETLENLKIAVIYAL